MERDATRIYFYVVMIMKNNDNHTDHMAMIITMIQRYNVNIKTRSLHSFYDNDHDAMWNCPRWHDMISSLMMMMTMMMMMMMLMMKDDIFVVADDDDNLGHGYDGDADADACSTLMASKHEPGIDKKTWFYTCQKNRKKLFYSFRNVLPSSLPVTNGNRINKENKNDEKGNDGMMLKVQVLSNMPRSYRFRARHLRWMMPLSPSSISSKTMWEINCFTFIPNQRYIPVLV